MKAPTKRKVLGYSSEIVARHISMLPKGSYLFMHIKRALFWACACLGGEVPGKGINRAKGLGVFVGGGGQLHHYAAPLGLLHAVCLPTQRPAPLSKRRRRMYISRCV